MSSIYTKQNILVNLQKVKKVLNNLYNEDYSLYELVTAFNRLTMKYQDLLLKIDKDENDRVLMKYIYNDMRTGAKEARKSGEINQKVIIKNPLYNDTNNKIKDNKEKSKKTIAKSLIMNKKVDISEITDDFPLDEKEMVYYVFNSDSKKNITEISNAFGIDNDEVNDTLNKVYDKAINIYEKKLILKNRGNNIE